MVSSWGHAEGDSGLSIHDGLDPIAIAAHELKTPLATIRQLSLELARTTNPADIELISRQIQLTTEQSLRLTQDITQAAKLQPALFPLEALNARRIVNSVAQELAPIYMAHDRRVEVRLPRQLPNVISHADLLKRILLNFGDNALYYADKKGKVIIEGRVTRKRDTVRFGVIDGGPQVSMAQSLQHTDYGRPGGSGLGLMIIETFAEVIQATTGVTRSQGNVHYYVDVPISKQLSLV